MALSKKTDAIINNLINALEIEIKTIGYNPIRITAKNGVFVESTGNLFIYRFEIDNSDDISDFSIMPDTLVKVKFNRENQEATVVSYGGIEIIIAFKMNNGNNIKQINIEMNNVSW